MKYELVLTGKFKNVRNHLGYREQNLAKYTATQHHTVKDVS